MLTLGGPAQEVRMGAHEAVGEDLDSELPFVFMQECDEFLTCLLGVEDESIAVTSPGAVVCGVLEDEDRASDTRHDVR